MATNSSALGSSRIRYCILKWVHAAHPDALTIIFNLSIESGTHPWKDATVVVLNKPNKPNYSQAKAYQPISLLECTGKLMEKVIAKQVNVDIEVHKLIPMTQFGSRPHHNAVNTITTLVYHIQATYATGCAGALLLSDILGFFNNINTGHITQVF